MARQAMRVLDDNPGHTGMEVFVTFLDVAEQCLNLIKPQVQAEAEARAEGRFADADAYRTEIFKSSNALAITSMTLVSHYPWLPEMEIPQNLRELWGLDELKH